MSNLLIPRIKLYAPHPKMEHKVGHIFVGEQYIHLCEEFPNNYRILYWWENITKEELPEYVIQLTMKGEYKKWKVFKYVFNYELNPPKHFYEPYIITDNKQKFEIPIKMCLPYID